MTTKHSRNPYSIVMKVLTMFFNANELGHMRSLIFFPIGSSYNRKPACGKGASCY